VGQGAKPGGGGMLLGQKISDRVAEMRTLPAGIDQRSACRHPDWTGPDDLRKADAIEVVIGQGAKPGGGGMLLGQKITERVAKMRNLPVGIDQRSACRHPDWTGPDDLTIKIHELREITNWEKPIYVKVGATRPYFDTALAVKSGADVVVLDGMQGGTAATQDVFIEHVGLPILAAIRPAVQALQDLDMHRKVQLIVSGGIRNGADVAKCLALGADAVAIGTAALIALGDNDPKLEAEYQKLGSTAGCYDDWHEGRDPAGITTQDPQLAARLDPVKAGHRLANYLAVLTMEAQIIARACGKSHLHNLEPDDLVALTVESAAMARVPLAGTNWIPGQDKY
jgi:glutamate synthase domain-containing protein 2